MKLSTSAVRLCLLIVGLLYFNFSCEDHTDPQTRPALTTKPVLRSDTRTFSLFTFQLTVDNAGTFPVKEYGIVFTTYLEADIMKPDVVTEPTIATGKTVAFKQAFGQGDRQEILNDVPDSKLTLNYVFQRAYAVLDNGEVVYGAVIKTKNGVAQ